MRRILGGAALVAALVAAYAGALHGDFLWDDDLHVTANPTIVGPLGLREIWTSARANYFPLVLTNFWLQHAAWGLNPVGYHVVTLACHALAAWLLWRVLAALNVRGAWIGATLWALHPVQVESVAWISELKNTQSAVFFLGAIWCWIQWQRAAGPVPAESRSRRSSWYLLALASAVLAILSKPSTVMLPFALALSTWWLEGRITWRHVIRLVPFVAISAVASGWTIWEQKHHSGALGPEWSQTFAERVIIAGRVVWFYLAKLVWPEPLIFIYPRWSVHASSVLSFVPVAAIVIALGGLLARSWRRPSAVAFAAFYFVALLFPVLGFFSVYFFRYSFVGDHFQYLASMGPLALAGSALGTAANGLRRSAAVCAAILIVACAVLTARQCRVYRSSEALWRDTVAKNPGATMAWLNLADTLAQAQRYEESLRTYRHALELAPSDPDAWNDLGNVLVMLGRPAEAETHFQRALELKPAFPEAHSNYGNALRLCGRSGEAIAHYRQALELNPLPGARVEALNNLGAELAETGHPEEALPYFREALQLNPRHAGAHDNLGSAWRELQQLPAAIAEHEEAIRLKPKSAEALANYGRTLVAAGRVDEALARFEQALALKPNLARARGNYAMALARAGRPGDAFAQLERAVELSPDSAEAHHNLGTALAQSRRLPEAIRHFERAVQLAPEFVLARVSLATALGASLRWQEAIPQLRAAIEADPTNPVAHAQLAVALVNTEQLAAAVPEFERALQLQPDSIELHNNFAQLLRALGRNREALQQFEAAADLQRNRPR